MSLSTILSIIHIITIGIMLNFNSGNHEHGLKTVACKQTLTRSRLRSHFASGLLFITAAVIYIVYFSCYTCMWGHTR